MKRPHKYSAKRTEYGGASYPSKAEAMRAHALDLLKAAGEIGAWYRGGRWEVAPGVIYIPDFEVYEKQEPELREAVLPDWVEDVKGVETQVFRLKARLFVAAFPSVPLMVLKQEHTYRFGEKQPRRNRITRVRPAPKEQE